MEGVERVARADADAALRALDARVSEAIMHALENHAVLEKKVRLNYTLLFSRTGHARSIWYCN